MHLKYYCSEYVRDLYGICEGFNGEYKKQYLYCIDNQDVVETLSNELDSVIPSNKCIGFNSGLVIEVNNKDIDGYVVVQSLYNKSNIDSLKCVMVGIAEYVQELSDKGFKEVMLIDNYAEYGSKLYSFDIAFILEKKNNRYGKQ